MIDELSSAPRKSEQPVLVRALVSWLWLAASLVLAACGGSEPVANGGSSETHFLRRCTSECGGGLSCECGVCTKRCSGDGACGALSERATCETPAAASCGGRAEPAVCELVCDADDDCAGLGSEFSCGTGVCRAMAAGQAGKGGSGGAPEAGRGGAPAGSGAVDAGSAGSSGGSGGTGDGGMQGQPCGDVVCGPSQSCCDRCQSLCIPATSGAFCPDDTDPNRTCGDAGTAQGDVCGAVTCAANERCCDHCQSMCVSAVATIACPDDTGAPRSCSDAGSGQCSAVGESCLTSACCSGLNCCSGIPVPAGEANCYASDCPDSDQQLKRDIVTADTDAVLAAVASLPIARWRYIDDPSAAPHIGPMAQDFHAAFEVGGDDGRIAKVDGDGVALSAIQALYRRVQALEHAQRVLSERNAELERELRSLRQP